MANQEVIKESAFVYSPDFMLYKFSESHPFNPIRVKMTYELLKDVNALDNNHIITPSPASEKDLLLGHSPDYINFMKSLKNVDNVSTEKLQNYGLDTEDTPVFNNMHLVSSFIVGGTLCAVDEVLNNRAKHALNLGGGLHHALYGKASGFCIYNDIVIAIKHIINEYNLKALYVDTDAHHGDGVQWAFYDEPQVCTFSIHETGRYLFPGTGGITERGTGKGLGYTFNLPMDAFTEDESWIECYSEAIEKIMMFFKPDIIITQNGADGHYYDPLTHLALTMNSYRVIPKIAHKLAHTYCNGHWVALGGGGYDIFRVVPRAWASIWMEMTNFKQSSDKLPSQWIEKWQKYSHNEIPTSWSDPDNIYDPIPRKDEINYKNKSTLRNVLYSISKETIGNKFLQRP